MRLVSLSIILSLASVASAETPKSDIEKSADPRSKVICKRFSETGSLVRGYKVCKTKADWDRARDMVRQNNPAGSCSRAGDGVSC